MPGDDSRRCVLWRAMNEVHTMSAMTLTRRTDYGVRILYELASDPDRYTSARELADRHRVPEAFLRKILMDLRQAGIVVAQRGRTGGYRLADEPGNISLGQVLDALNSQVVRLPCIVGTECLQDGTCLVWPLWRYLEQRFNRELDSIDLSMVVELGQQADGSNRRSDGGSNGEG